MVHRPFPALFLLTLLGLTAIWPAETEAAQPPGHTEERLATQAINSKAFVPPGGRRVVWRERRGRLWTMVVNGEAEKAYGNIGVPVFNADGTEIAYTAQRGTEMLAASGSEAFVVRNGREGPVFQQVARLQFTGDGRHIAYMASDGTGFQPMLDDKPLEPTGRATLDSGFWINADGSRWAYWLDDGLVVDGTLRPQHKSRSGGERVSAAPRFSPDGRRLAYRVVRGVDTVVVIDDQESRPYESATDPVFSPDSRHVAYYAVRDRRMFAVIDGVEGPPQFRILGTEISFSPDSQRFAYFGLPQNIPYYWLPKGTDPRRVSGLFLIGGRFDETDEIARQGKPLDTLSARAENVGTLIWSPDSEHWVYTRPESHGTVVVTDGQVSPVHEAVRGLAVDSEGRALYGARKGMSWQILHGGEPIGAPVDELLATVLSADGGRVAWVARGGGKQFVATPAGEGPAYDAVFSESLAFTNEATALVYVARRGNEFFRVTQQLAEE